MVFLFTIAGGAVQDRDFCGTLPTFALGGPNDSGVDSRLIPTMSTDQFGHILAAWFGVPAGSRPAIFPNLSKFATPTLGFLG